MSTTIRINKDVKELLKLKSVETGISQIDLANKYILEGIKFDDTPNKPLKTIEEIEKILEYDKIGEKSTKKTYEHNYEVPEELHLCKEGEEKEGIHTIEEIEKILDYDKKEGDDVLENIAGLIKTDEVTNSVKLKKESYER